MPAPDAVEIKERRWRRLAILWSLYYLLMFTVGLKPQYTQLTIWWGGALVGLLTLPTIWRQVRFKDVPLEGLLLGGFFLWALTGIFVARDMAKFQRFIQLIFEFVLVFNAVALILKNSGGFKWLFLAFVGAAAYRIVNVGAPIGIDQLISTGEAVARIEGANAVGFCSALGVVGTVALLGETRSLWIRGSLVFAGLFSAYGILLSASRSAFTALMLVALLWPTLCLLGTRFTVGKLIGAVVILLLCHWAYQVILLNTNMGVRFLQSTQMEDGSTQERFNLVQSALGVFLKNPVFGCGLGQFGVASGTGYYAHNEVAELLATLGLPGVFLYYGAYFSIWRRLARSLRLHRDPLVRYRINISRMAVLILLITGALSRINFLSQETFFLLAIAVGTGHWAEGLARGASRIFVPAPVQPIQALAGFPPCPPTAGWGFLPDMRVLALCREARR